MKLSIVVFFFNEESNLPVLKRRLEGVLKDLTTESEIVLVNDGSTDSSAMVVGDWLSESRNIVSLRFSRNFGSHAAVAAGLQNCTGDCAVLMAADLQDPPELIPDLVAKYCEGNDIVWACRTERLGESWFTKIAASTYYQLMRWLGLPNMPPKGADFLLVSRKVIDAVNASPEKHTSILAMILWMGFRQTFIQYVKQARHSGRSKWTFSRKIKLLIDSVVSFSYVPIRAASVVGLFMAAAGFSYSVWIALLWALGRITSGTGYAAIMCVLLIGQGSILFTLGILGEYIWRTFDESRGRPRFIIDQLIRSPASQSGSVSAGPSSPEVEGV
jgi:dolichol-phosphate mannosyltransferase